MPGGFNIVLGGELARALGVRVGDPVTLISPSGQVTPAGVVPRVKSMTVAGVFAFQSGMNGKGGTNRDVMQIDGGANFSKDVRADGVSLSGHLHRAQGSTAPTSTPIRGASFRGMNAAAGRSMRGRLSSPNWRAGFGL